MKKDITISPIFYQDCKKKLIQKGLTNLFPKDINCFIDLFGGSGIVSMNVEAKKYILNDINPYLAVLYRLFMHNDAEQIIKHIQKRIIEYNLPTFRSKRNDPNDTELEKKRAPYKEAYMKFRDYFNSHDYSEDIKKNQDARVLDFYTLMFFSFSQQFRFNGEGKYNMPFGNDCFSEKNQEYIRGGCSFFQEKDVSVFEGSYEKPIDINTCGKNDFVYLDPPYLNTDAVYNEKGGWTIDDEKNLYSFCESLDKAGIKWGMSNVFKNKGKDNTSLIDWCNSKGWGVTHLDMVYSACGKGNSNADEVYICNYDISNGIPKDNGFPFAIIDI